MDWTKPTVQLLGRWQPWHDGHTELFKRAHKRTGQVCIQIRDMPENSSNPYSMGMRQNAIVEALRFQGFTKDVDYVIQVVPNIVDITYGRNVGYTITEETLPEEIEKISATEIRKNGQG